MPELIMNYKFFWVDNETGQVLRTWVRTPPIKVGRGIFADICIDSPSISRRHCEFFLDPHGTLIVHDLGSKNGVLIDGKRVTRGVITPESEIRIGLIKLRVEMTEEEIDDDRAQPKSRTHGDETQRVEMHPAEDDRYEIG
jgi:pSer/pThr/pTyr-binding forkhead associated (FHA) protein